MLFKLEIVFTMGTFTLPSVDQRFIDDLNWAMSRKEVFKQLDECGNSITVNTEHVMYFRTLKI